MAKKKTYNTGKQLDWVNLDNCIVDVNTERLEDWQIEWLNINGYSLRSIGEEIVRCTCSSTYHEGLGYWIDILMKRDEKLRKGIR